MAQAQILRLAWVRAAISSGEAQRLREEAQLTIGEVARACGVDQSTVWRWESGQRRPRGQPALKLASLIESLREAAQHATNNSDGAEEQLPGHLDAANESPLTSAN
jgi:DNA-binding transcriptional regulator YiaG